MKSEIFLSCIEDVGRVFYLVVYIISILASLIISFIRAALCETNVHEIGLFSTKRIFFYGISFAYGIEFISTVFNTSMYYFPVFVMSIVANIHWLSPGVNLISQLKKEYE